jgi:putative transposase
LARRYAAFTVGISQVEETIRYIQKQKEHHRKASFQDEFLKILKKQCIEYDERYIWD